MRHGPDQLARGVARQLRIRVQRDDVFHPDEHGSRTDDEREAVAVTLPQQGVEVRQLAALALVPHPDPLPGFQRRGR